MFGIDYIRYILILLSQWIICLTILSSQKIKFKNIHRKEFTLITLLLLISLYLTFSSLDYILFYIRFERSLIPTFILILGWGYQPERLQAGIYILFYTTIFSLPLLIILLLISRSEQRSIIYILNFFNCENEFKVYYYLALTMAFIVKLPIYIFHLWLPKAHVEAPLAGSIVLAGILLKLGGYGLIRVLVLVESSCKEIIWFWIRVRLIGGIYVRLLCLRQLDIKSLIAYSSVVHIGLVLCGILTLSWWGYVGALIIILGHGLCSSGIFCLANIVYERVLRRRFLINKGWLSLIPRISLWWFLLRIGNIASPPRLNLAGEIILIISLVNWNKLIILILVIVSFFRGCYSLYLYRLSQHGVLYNGVSSFSSSNVQEFIRIFLHWLPLNILVLNVNIFII